MNRALLALLFAQAGCFEDRYRCTDDAQCDLGEGGRCEIDGYCTSHDASCDTRRRYEAHAGELTNACYDDRVALLNACAGGQGAAAPTGCAASVCAQLPACCDVAWTDACAQVAHEACGELVCDTRIALTIPRAMNFELWDLRWDGATWSITAETRLAAPLAWVAPAPGTALPRLAGTTATTLEIGDVSIEVGAGRTYQGITSVGFDRDGRDTIAAGYSTSNSNVVEIWKLDDFTVREESLPGAQFLSWGDQNRDAFPDGIIRSGGSYSFLENLEDATFSRKVSNQTAANVSGGATPGSPTIRSIDWLDFNRDGLMDLAVFGSSVRVHTNADGLRDVAERELDCEPPSTARSCEADPEPDLEQVSFVGAALPTADEPSIIFAQFPGRKLWRARQQDGSLSVAPFPFPGDTCTCQDTCTMCPGPNCSCTYDCSNCVPIQALVARDLDGDHRLDLVAIDAKLRLYTALAAASFAWSLPTQIPTTFSANATQINASVSGAPLGL